MSHEEKKETLLQIIYDKQNDFDKLHSISKVLMEGFPELEANFFYRLKNLLIQKIKSITDLNELKEFSTEEVIDKFYLRTYINDLITQKKDQISNTTQPGLDGGGRSKSKKNKKVSKSKSKKRSKKRSKKSKRSKRSKRSK